MNNITILEKHTHSKASEAYVHVKFAYKNPKRIYDLWVPIENRRANLKIDFDDKKALNAYLERIYSFLNPKNLEAWKADQNEFWSHKNAEITKQFFDALSQNLKWCCVDCDLPKNPNWARRVQDLKEMGYSIATDTNRHCPKCDSNKTHLMLLPIPRTDTTGNGYEQIPKKLRERILSTLKHFDAYEAKQSSHLLPDHKFPEIRWDKNTKSINPDDMSEDEIRQKFQLLTNQRNEQKREICRHCYQTDQRGKIFGINFYPEGSGSWDPSIPKTGVAAEDGCRGCPWYDIEAWRESLNLELSK